MLAATLLAQQAARTLGSSYEVIGDITTQNAALYEIRQSFIHEATYLNYHEMDRRMQSHEAYKALPVKVCQQILMLLDFYSQQDGNRLTM
jgi:uncharacterized protein YfbU (UPF0304 family)